MGLNFESCGLHVMVDSSRLQSYTTDYILVKHLSVNETKLSHTNLKYYYCICHNSSPK